MNMVLLSQNKQLFLLTALLFLEISFLKIVKKSIFLLNISCLIFDSTKTIRLFALNFYQMIVDSGLSIYPRAFHSMTLKTVKDVHRGLGTSLDS